MAKLIDEAMQYEPPQTKNIADLDSVPTDLDVIDETFKEGTPEEFKVKTVEINGDKYRMPVSVLKHLKAILEIKPDLKRFKVQKSGIGMDTVYTVIPLE